MNTLRSSTRLLALFALLAACEYPTVSLGKRASFLDASVADASSAARDAAADADDDSDEGPDDDDVPCVSSAACTDGDHPFCHPTRLLCVECLRDSDCEGLALCEPDGDCDAP